jgi:hypothetical protein
MNTYETTATVEDHGQIIVAGVPFEPGTEVAITISPKRRSPETVASADEAAWASARNRMQALFRTIQGFRNSPRIPREELYERGSLR